MSELRYWCRLYPCTDPQNPRPDVYGGRSFPTRDSYERHLRRGHFLNPGAPGVPEPFIAQDSSHTWEGSDDRD